MATTSDRNVSTTWLAVAGYAMIVVLAAILFVTPPARGYEISLYDAYPWYFWALAGLALFVGQFIALRGAFGTSWNWRALGLGLGLVLAVEAFLVFMPYFRGYPVFGRADVLTHVGDILIIHETGSIGADNFYPSLHLFVLALSYATGVEPIHVINSFSGFVTLFSVLASFALITTVYDRRRALLTLPFVTLLVNASGHLNSSPYAQSLLLLPFVLYLFIKDHRSQQLSIRTALAIAIVGIVFYHPITTLFLLIVFAIYGLSHQVLNTDLLVKERPGWHGRSRWSPVFQVTLSVFVAWYLTFVAIVSRFRTVVRTLLYPDRGEAPLEQHSATVSETSPALIDIALVALVRYGVAMCLVGLAGLYALYGGYRALRGRAEMSVHELTFAATAIGFAGLSAVFFVMDLLVGFGRPLWFALLFSGLLAGPLFYELYRTTRWHQGVTVALYLSVAALIVLSTFALYHSPYGGRINHQVTDAELDGSEWVLENREPAYDIADYGLGVRRFRDVHYGTSNYSEDLIVSDDTPGPPPHFNYTERAYLGENYDASRYLVIANNRRTFYQEVYPDYQEFWQFTPSDYDRLERDRTVSRVYSNGELDAYFIEGAAAE